MQKKIVILGGGSAGWMTAAALAKFLPTKKYQIRLVSSKEIGTVGVGEATIPHIRQFNDSLGIDENEFMRVTGATYKLAIEFSGWGKTKNSSYFHPFGRSGQDLNGLGFHHFWLRLNKEGKVAPFDQFSMAVAAAKQDKFQYPSSDINSPLSEYGYAFHLDATLYAKYLSEFSQNLGVEHIEGQVASVQQHANGDIQSLDLENGQIIEGDVFVDCSGFRGLLIEQILKTGYENWTHWLPCNKALAVPSKKLENPPPYTRATAQQVGWQWRIPLQHRTGNGLVYCSEYLDDDEAKDILLGNIEQDVTTEPKQLSFVTGKRRKSWNKNCVAIGLSAGFLEPLESTSLYLVQVAIQKLIEYFPSDKITDIERDTFNQQLDTEYLRCRDFIILHYKTVARDDSEFWRYCKNMPVPDSLAQQMALFKQTGNLNTYRHGLFMPTSWLSVFIGQGYIPDSYDFRAKKVSINELNAYMQKHHVFLEKTAQNMLSHSSSITHTKGTSQYPPVSCAAYGVKA